MGRLEHVGHVLSVESLRATSPMLLIASGGTVTRAASRAPVIGILNFADKADDWSRAAEIHDGGKIDGTNWKD
jgi:hypothetical protein